MMIALYKEYESINKNVYDGRCTHMYLFPLNNVSIIPRNTSFSHLYIK